MRRSIFAAGCAALIAGLGGCAPSSPRHPPGGLSTTSPRCGLGVMGGCVPKPTGFAAPRITGTLIPDVSEFQSCALHSEAIIRIYEAGTDREDSTAVCHARELARLHAWAAGYVFMRAGRSCSSTVTRTLAIARSLPGLQLVIADAETGIRNGLVRCFLAGVERGGYPAREYTCPGCGDEQVGGVWIASYPSRPAGRWIAHQFSSEWECRGVHGDCSVNEGILSIHRATPVPRAALLRERASLRRILVQYGCRRRVQRRERLGPRCVKWFAAGSRINKELSA